MIPAGQIVNAYERELRKLGILSNADQDSAVNTDKILEAAGRIHTEKSRAENGGESVHNRGNVESLNEMLRFAEHTTKAGRRVPGGRTTLQIGGSDPLLLAKASAIGAAFGYSCVNLNCGCPSGAVSGRSGGAALMKEPMHVARCVEAMNRAVTDLHHYESACATKEGFDITPISVKHRLGVRDASTYDAAEDRLKNDEEEAFPDCRDFVKAVTFSSDVGNIQVHTRLGLLGDFDKSPTDPAASSSTLWVPGSSTNDTRAKEKSIDHKRAQYQAKKRARKATIQNRNVPPLRPNVVDLLADEFPHVQIVANGGIRSMKAVQNRIAKGPDNVIGAMVGRAAINHPCSFASADSLWCDSGSVNYLPWRGDILLDYIDYCDEEEQRVKALGVSIPSLAALRRKLVAVPFHLFVGEECNDVYQRRIRKLINRAGRHTAKSILMAALLELPPDPINKSVGEFTNIEDLKVQTYVERSGPLQKNIY
eukprot:CAMPEP_0113299080 /NCGR_PEP_ID=MMETSP0010_2-20120614/1258_1 /TAXON_ID=216773 ORGANISM="Corethron hystrix, Strain 308" /NCGR_SAMPLE_ID=MMETSP0010_2 /ASSEMBLY_ACC=CAM_ASM_000155 /LENGTH=479 /DNA_ID=CAMNT_0000152243 /DNA_START=445 /DNA_END=1884 /DNA_ORIENTATION=+ /assembly_acc=CAM_ASM_000155